MGLSPNRPGDILCAQQGIGKKHSEYMPNYTEHCLSCLSVDGKHHASHAYKNKVKLRIKTFAIELGSQDLDHGS